MKKFFFYAIIAAAVLMTGCNKDDDEKTTTDNGGSTNTGVNLLDNQAAMNGDVIDITSTVAYQINDGENRYFVDAINQDAGFSIRFDLYESIVNKTVNLSSPLSAGTDISIMVEMENLYLDQEIHPGDQSTEPYFAYNGTANGQEFEQQGSMFKSGTLKVSHTQEFGFVLVCTGELFNGMKVDLRIVVPQAEIDVWNSSK
ncbi:MAG: hypothetical protein IJU90_08880 [Bacteroidales bacterium]|nr:hypothetical protein [Bacteroidales bacterium]